MAEGGSIILVGGRGKGGGRTKGGWVGGLERVRGKSGAWKAWKCLGVFFTFCGVINGHATNLPLSLSFVRFCGVSFENENMMFVSCRPFPIPHSHSHSAFSPALRMCHSEE